jgi:ubiquinone/menaquinone biosynthesis C-methylase UbiE
MSDSDRAIREQAEKYILECTEYSNSSEKKRLIRDWENKSQGARAVIKDFEKRVGSIKNQRLLDIGFGNGQYSIAFAQNGAKVSGLEVNEILYTIAQEKSHSENIEVDFQLYNGTKFPFRDNYFEYAFSVSVLEHVSDPKAFLAEAYRVLKPGGKFYLAFPNKWRPLEAHTKILFLGYLPRSLVQILLRQFLKRNTIEELNLHFISFWTVKRLLHEIPFSIVSEKNGTGFQGAIKRLLWSKGVHHSAILGTVMIILEKS